MASQQSQKLSHKAGEAVGHAQLKKDELLDQASNATQQSRNTDQSGNNQNASYAAQASTFIQQTGEQVKNMAQGAAEAVKNTLGMNADNTTNPNNPSNPCNNPSNPINNPCNSCNNPSNTSTRF